MSKVLLKNQWSRQWPGLILLSFLVTTPAGAETLQLAWDIALGVNHSLKAARENTAAAESARLPGLTLEAGYIALDNSPGIKVGLGTDTADDLLYK